MKEKSAIEIYAMQCLLKKILNTKIINADATAGVRVISGRDKSSCREKVYRLLTLCLATNLTLSTKIETVWKKYTSLYSWEHTFKTTSPGLRLTQLL